MKLVPIMVQMTNEWLDAWYGYVGVEHDHILYGLPMEQIADVIGVHGGITYTGEALWWWKGQVNVPEGLFWMGFDTLHAMDVQTFIDDAQQKVRLWSNKSDWYVREQLDQLTEQIAAIQFGGYPSNNARRMAGLGPRPVRKLRRAFRSRRNNMADFITGVEVSPRIKLRRSTYR